MKTRRDEQGHLWLEGLPPLCEQVLAQVPGLLETSDPAVRARLLPKAYDDLEDEAQWRQLSTPELEHLILSRVEIMRKDLASLERGRGGGLILRIGRGHESAWLSGLNAARLSLFIQHGLTPSDMNRGLDEVADDGKLQPLVQISILAFLQQLLIGAGE